MSKLEDPAFTLKPARVITPYPDASASDVSETAVQRMDEVKTVTSCNVPGISVVEVAVRDTFIERRDRVPTNSVQGNVTLGATPPTVSAGIRPPIEATDLPPGCSLEWGLGSRARARRRHRSAARCRSASGRCRSSRSSSSAACVGRR